MLDLYQILIPVYSIITIINLIYLKLAIRDTMTPRQIKHKNIPADNHPPQD
jgi:hypothetical protein